MNDLAQRITANSVWLFVGMVALLSIWETLAPRRELLLSTPRRWLSHLALYLVLLFAVRLTGLAPLAFSISRSHHAGLLNRPEWPWSLRFWVAFIVIDLVRYWVHRLEHSVPSLWRMHLLHHSDRDFDFSDGLRFHPADTALQMSGLMLLIWIAAPPPLAVAAADLLAIGVGMFSHANLELPPALERGLRWVFVTPGLHQIHHSIDEREQGRNLGVTFSWWDRWFGTFIDSPSLGYGAMRFGVAEVDAAESLSPLHMILAPFRTYPAGKGDLEPPGGNDKEKPGTTVSA